LKLSCIVPAHNEEDCITETITQLYSTLTQANIQHEILVINDNSTDKTKEVLRKISWDVPSLKVVDNTPPSGYGLAVRLGLNMFQGDVVCVYHADASDNPEDVVRYFGSINSYDCVFGSRWIEGGKVLHYPISKRIINRLANYLISMLLRKQYTDFTNGFKMYRDYVVEDLKPFVSCHFNITLELSIKTILRGYSYTVIPNSWLGRESGESKFKIVKMGSRYLFTLFYCLFENWFSQRNTKNLYKNVKQ